MKIAVIPDGARRWARRVDAELEESYKTTFVRLYELAERLSAHPVSELHIYLLSKFNLARTDSDLVPCIRQETEFVKKLDAEEMLAGVVGDVASVCDRCAEAQSLVDYSFKPRAGEILRSPRVWLYFGYSAEWHLADSIRRFDPENSCPANELARRLASDSSLDLAIRTGGERSLSDFLPLQLRYARLEFLEDLFNDVPVDTYLELILRVSRTRANRRFGC